MGGEQLRGLGVALLGKQLDVGVIFLEELLLGLLLELEVLAIDAIGYSGGLIILHTCGQSRLHKLHGSGVLGVGIQLR